VYQITLYLDCCHDLYHLSNILGGLFRLVRAQVVRRVNFSPTPVPEYAADPVTLYFEVVKTAGRETRRIAIDVYDRSDVFAAAALRHCDVYFKRSYFQPDLDALPAALREKVRPFGLNYAARTRTSTVLVLAHLLRRYLRGGCRVRDRREFQSVLRKYLASPDISDFEQLPDRPVEPVVLFQTRVWPPEELGTDSAREINERRAALVRLLKSEFGTAFRGGLVPDAYARKCYPDALAASPSRRSVYIADSRRALIGVYTRGLHHSLAFKLPEYLASAKCIVSDPLRNRLPAPLSNGCHYLEFTRPEQCVENCVQLLRDPELAWHMRQENWAYYRAEVRADRRMLRCLEDAFAVVPADSPEQAAWPGIRRP
jgi:hypothetical protein